MPCRDLLLSPDHAVFVDNVLIPIKHLINGKTIVQQQTNEVTYYHIELGEHDVLLADGMPAESYLENGDRGAFDNGGGMIALHPDFGIRPVSYTHLHPYGHGRRHAGGRGLRLDA